jgi:mRNA interferase RelE/StbE
LVWRVEFTPKAWKDLHSLDHETQRQIQKYFRKRIAGKEDPRRFGKALTGDKLGLWRYRIGDYRVICSIENDKLLVLVLAADHRKQVYDD